MIYQESLSFQWFGVPDSGSLLIDILKAWYQMQENQERVVSKIPWSFLLNLTQS